VATSTEFIEESEGTDPDRLQLVKVLELLRVEWLTAGSAGPSDTEPVWQVTLDEKIRPYREVASIDQYLEIKERILAEAAQEVPSRPFIVSVPEPLGVIVQPRETPTAPDVHKVFVVYGRNNPAKVAMFELLRAFGLHPLEFSELRAATGKPSPYIGEILEAGFAISQACVVLMTPDEEVRLRADFIEEDVERVVAHQPRPNVLLEAGMALHKYWDRTVLVELGRIRLVTDLAGIHVLRMDDTVENRKELAERLLDAQCDVRLEGTAWQTAGRFDDAVGGGPPVHHQPVVDTGAERARATLMGRLRQEYILSHDELTPALLAGTEPLPIEWVEQRLRELRQSMD
jgi:predicted nucleotide-binding protein